MCFLTDFKMLPRLLLKRVYWGIHVEAIKICRTQKEMSAVKHETKWIITNFSILLLHEITISACSRDAPGSKHTAEVTPHPGTRRAQRAAVEAHRNTVTAESSLVHHREKIRFSTTDDLSTIASLFLSDWVIQLFYVCFFFFSGTFSLFNLIKGCGRLKRDLTPSAQCHQCTRPRAWCWKSARTSICRADRNEAPLPSSNRTRRILICWVKKGGLVNPPSKPSEGIYYIWGPKKGKYTYKLIPHFLLKSTKNNRKPLLLKNAHPHAHMFMHVHKHWGCTHPRNAKYLPLRPAWMAPPISTLSSTVH